MVVGSVWQLRRKQLNGHLDWTSRGACDLQRHHTNRGDWEEAQFMASQVAIAQTSAKQRVT